MVRKQGKKIKITDPEKLWYAKLLLICQFVDKYSQEKGVRGLDREKLNLLDIIWLGGRIPLSKVYEYLK